MVGGALGAAGGFGGAGGAAAGGGGGGAGRGGGAAAGGAGRGGAAAGGAGRDGGGAPLGGLFGLPSSSLAWAMTSGALCACDGEAINCIAVRAVVASSTRRRFVMMVCILGNFAEESLGNKVWQLRSCDQRISVRPDCGGPQRRAGIYF